jgi:hypothetical protein
MIAIDSATLDLIEWLCRKFQWLTGRTNVWLAAQLTNLSIVVYFVWVATYFQILPPIGRILLGLFCAGLLYVLSQTVFKMPIEASEKNAYHRVAKGFRNPRRVRDAPLRISFLFLTISLFLLYRLLILYINLRIAVALLSYPLVVLTTVVLYILACDPLPPCPGKVREMLRDAALARRPA